MEGTVLARLSPPIPKGGNKWVFGGEYLLKNKPYKEEKIPVAQFMAEGGYYLKVLSDARKTLFVYAGASALSGYETVNWGDKVLHDGAMLHDKDSFIYGGALTLDVEFLCGRPYRPARQPQGKVSLGQLHRAFPYAVRRGREVHH